MDCQIRFSGSFRFSLSIFAVAMTCYIHRLWSEKVSLDVDLRPTLQVGGGHVLTCDSLRVMRKLKEYDSEQQTDDDYGDVESRYPRTLQFQSDEEDEKSAAVVASKSEGEDQKWAVEKDKKRRLSGERHKVGSGSSPKDSSPKEKEKEKGKEKKDLRSLFNLPSRQPAPQAQANFGTIGINRTKIAPVRRNIL